MKCIPAYCSNTMCNKGSWGCGWKAEQYADAKKEAALVGWRVHGWARHPWGRGAGLGGAAVGAEFVDACARGGVGGGR